MTESEFNSELGALVPVANRIHFQKELARLRGAYSAALSFRKDLANLLGWCTNITHSDEGQERSCLVCKNGVSAPGGKVPHRKDCPVARANRHLAGIEGTALVAQPDPRVTALVEAIHEALRDFEAINMVVAGTPNIEGFDSVKVLRSAIATIGLHSGSSPIMGAKVGSLTPEVEQRFIGFLDEKVRNAENPWYGDRLPSLVRKIKEPAEQRSALLGAMASHVPGAFERLVEFDKAAKEPTAERPWTRSEERMPEMQQYCEVRVVRFEGATICFKAQSVTECDIWVEKDIGKVSPIAGTEWRPVEG